MVATFKTILDVIKIEFKEVGIVTKGGLHHTFTQNFYTDADLQ